MKHFTNYGLFNLYPYLSFLRCENRTFNLPDLDFLLRGVKGNGMTLGMTDGTLNLGFAPDGSQYTRTATDVYGQPVGTAPTYTQYTLNKSVGITTDPTKSGIESVIDTNTNYIIKY